MIHGEKPLYCHLIRAKRTPPPTKKSLHMITIPPIKMTEHRTERIPNSLSKPNCTLKQNKPRNFGNNSIHKLDNLEPALKGSKKNPQSNCKQPLNSQTWEIKKIRIITTHFLNKKIMRSFW